jgi:hypothetical protein
MVINILTEQKIISGSKLIENIDKNNLSPKAALWLFESSTGRWRLILAFPLLQQRGSKHFYKAVQSALLKFPERPISLQDVSIIDYKESFITLLKSAIQIGPDINPTRFTNCYFNGVKVDDALIYRLV